MSRKIVSIRPQLMEGSPALARYVAYENFFLSRGYIVTKISWPTRFWEKLLLGVLLLRSKPSLILISMPPFNLFFLFFLFNKKIILDVRDGWSIAQATGYGGTSEVKPVRSALSKFIERSIIRRTYMSITCTYGLQKHLQEVSGRNVLLIPNGLLDEDIEFIDKIKGNRYLLNNREETVFCCAGQFSEYGGDKVKKLLAVVAARYSVGPLRLQLIGSNRERNSWVVEYFKDLTAGRGSVEILPRQDRESLYGLMLNADYGLIVLRDPAYEFGTKIYDYIALGIPVINYFEEANCFTKYFNACLDTTWEKGGEIPEIRRSVLVQKAFDKFSSF